MPDANHLAWGLSEIIPRAMGNLVGFVAEFCTGLARWDGIFQPEVHGSRTWGFIYLYTWFVTKGNGSKNTIFYVLSYFREKLQARLGFLHFDISIWLDFRRSLDRLRQNAAFGQLSQGHCGILAGPQRQFNDNRNS